MNLFQDEIEREAIERIRKFAKIAAAMELDVTLGFSGGKDSQVAYDLCKRSGIEFKAYFNHAFESGVTLKFIKQYYPEVIFRRIHKYGFIENIWKNYGGVLPTVRIAYCCRDYKHNPKCVDACSIVGVRRAESYARRGRKIIEIKNKTTQKKNKALISSYFEERCQGIGSTGIIQLKPILDWSDSDIWSYIHKYGLPVNPEYKHFKRVGCLVCPKANFLANYKSLLKYPKLINAFILATEKSQKPRDWVIRSDKKDYSDDKCYYICRWLNHSFMPFTKRQQKAFEEVKKKYNKINNGHNESK